MHRYANIAMEESFIVSTINFKKGTQSKFWETTPTINDLSYTTDNNRLYIADKIVGQSLDNLDVGRGNTINTTKGRFGGATIGKDNFLGRMGYYIYPDWNTLSEDKCSVEVYFIDHQIGYYPEDVMIKMKKLAQQDNDDCLTNNHVFSCGSTCNGWEHYANLVGYSAYNITNGATALSNLVYSDLTIYPESTSNFIGSEAVINKTTYTVLGSNITRYYTSNDGLTQVARSVTLNFDKALPDDGNNLNTTLFYNYAIPADIWTNDWTLSNPDAPQIGAFNIAEPTLAMGRRNKAYASESFAIGRDNVAKGDVTMAWGVSNTCIGAGSVATGKNNTTNGNYSAAFGQNNTTGNINTFVCGVNNNNSGQNAFATGDTNTITTAGKNGFTAGYNNTVSKDRAVAVGASNTAGGVDSLCAGTENVTEVKATATLGKGLKTGSGVPQGQVIVGAYNNTDTNAYFIVGCGGTNTARDNAFKVTKECGTFRNNVIVNGNLTAGNGTVTCASGYTHISSSLLVGPHAVNSPSTNIFEVGDGTYDSTTGVTTKHTAMYITRGKVSMINTRRILLDTSGNSGTTDIQLRGRTVIAPSGVKPQEGAASTCILAVMDTTTTRVLDVSKTNIYLRKNTEITDAAGYFDVNTTANFNSVVNCNETLACNRDISINDSNDKGYALSVLRTKSTGTTYTSAFYNAAGDDCPTTIRRTYTTASGTTTETNRISITDIYTHSRRPFSTAVPSTSDINTSVVFMPTNCTKWAVALTIKNSSKTSIGTVAGVLDASIDVIKFGAIFIDSNLFYIPTFTKQVDSEGLVLWYVSIEQSNSSTKLDGYVDVYSIMQYR